MKKYTLEAAFDRGRKLAEENKRLKELLRKVLPTFEQVAMPDPTNDDLQKEIEKVLNSDTD